MVFYASTALFEQFLAIFSQIRIKKECPEVEPMLKKEGVECV